MEPMNATVRYTADKAEVWVPTQNAEASLAALSTASGLPLAQCEAYQQTLGGGFGRRGGTQDYVRQATLIAKEFPGMPVKLIWSREEDQAHDFYRPISQCLAAGGLDENGNLRRCTSACPASRSTRTSRRPNIKDGKDVRQLQGLWKEPGDAQIGYTVPNLRTEYAMRNTHVPVGPWRGVNTNQNGVYLECFIEELAKAAGKDSARVPPRAHEEPSQAPRRAQRRRRERRLGQAAAGGRSSRHRAVHGLRQLLGGDRRSLGRQGRQGEGASHGARARTAATRSIRTRSRRRSKARSLTA